VSVLCPNFGSAEFRYYWRRNATDFGREAVKRMSILTKALEREGIEPTIANEVVLAMLRQWLRSYGLVDDYLSTLAKALTETQAEDARLPDATRFLAIGDSAQLLGHPKFLFLHRQLS